MKFNKINNHIIISVMSRNYLIDTGSPNSFDFNNGCSIVIDDKNIGLEKKYNLALKAGMDNLIGLDISGVIGLDVFSKYGLTIDYDNNEILLQCNNSDDLCEFTFSYNGYITLDDVKINGKKVCATIDVGAYNSVVFENYLLETDKTEKIYNDYNNDIGNFSGYFYNANIAINCEKFTNRIIVECLDNKYQRCFGIYNVFLNPNVFTDNKIIFDFKNKKIKYIKREVT